MIFADKLIMLRKKKGWSQEELAHELGVSRQSVSKWEGAQSIPDLDKIVRLSKLFGVSTDYLLKDDLEELPEVKAEPAGKIKEEEQKPDDPETAYMTLADVTDYFKITDKASLMVSAAVALMLLSPVPVILGLGFENSLTGSNGSLSIAGICIMSVILFIGIIMLLISYITGKKYAFVSKDDLSLEFGAAGIAEDKREKTSAKNRKMKLVGIVFLSLGALFFVGLFINSFILLYQLENTPENYDANIAFITIKEVIGYVFQILMFISLSVGFFFTLLSFQRRTAIDRILEEGSYTKRNKKRAAVIRIFSSLYFSVFVVALTVLFLINITAMFFVLVGGLALYFILYAVLSSELIKK